MILNKYVIIIFAIFISLLFGVIGFYVGRFNINKVYKVAIESKDRKIQEMKEVIEQLDRKYREKEKQLFLSERKYRTLINRLKDVENRPIQKPSTEDDAVKLLKEMGYDKK